MMNILSRADADLMVWLNGFHNSFFDGFMYLTSEKWVWVPVYMAIFFVILNKYGLKRQTAIIVLMFAITITLADTTCAAYPRPIFCRPRPCHPDSPIAALIHTVNGYHSGHYGMPSCHSANSFALAALVTLLFRSRRLTAFIYIWAVIHTYSRIYLGVHYPGDILIGGIVGTFYAVLLYRAYLYVIAHETFLNSNKAREIPTRSCYANIILATGGTIFTLLIIVAATGHYNAVLKFI